jgi:hypothetical protein
MIMLRKAEQWHDSVCMCNWKLGSLADVCMPVQDTPACLGT